METERKRKIRKPEGVFILCLTIFLNFGVYQFLNDFSAMRQAESETPLPIAILLISFDVFSAASAIWAFFGDNTGRIALLTFMSLNMLWSIFILIIGVSYGNFDMNKFAFLFSLIKPLILFGISWWYFTRKDIMAYYHQDNQYEFF
jgi:hypothetical protein